VHDGTGAPAATADVGSQGPFTGLDVGFRTEVALPVACIAVDATLVTFANRAELEAFDSDGTPASVASMNGTQGAAETLRVTGTSIDRATINARHDEALLLRLSFEVLRQ
jgi:hypothetical protein